MVNETERKESLQAYDRVSLFLDRMEKMKEENAALRAEMEHMKGSIRWYEDRNEEAWSDFIALKRCIVAKDEALGRAKRFIKNGTHLGYIPEDWDMSDPASETFTKVDEALALTPSSLSEEARLERKVIGSARHYVNHCLAGEIDAKARTAYYQALVDSLNQLAAEREKGEG